jgi:hypothetical protein
MKKRHITFSLVLCGTAVLMAAEPAKPEKFADADPTAEQPAEESKFDWGGDIRLRTVYFDDIPYNIGIDARGGRNSFQRYRTRLWGEIQATDSLKLKVRAVNEFRTYQDPDTTKSWDPLDEIVIDNLFADWTAGDWNLRVGRQDLIYGTGKLILDGTPKDGSRTIYFDAVKASYTGIENTVIDLLGLYTQAEDPLAILSEDRDLVGKASSAYDGAEAGGGVYIKNNSMEKLPLEAYYLLKSKEEAWTSPATGVLHDDNDRHTVGTRFMPKFSEQLDGNLELAYQFGDDISAFMIDSQINYHFDGDMKPCLGLGWYHLSGDDASSATDEGWNSLWARWPQYSELYVYGYDTEGGGRWSNLSMPHIDLTVNPCSRLKTSLMAGYMLAPEKDGIGGGSNRGLLVTLWNRFTLKENLFSDGDKLTGHLLLEMVEPGDYYSDDQQDDTSLFARLELNYAF